MIRSRMMVYFMDEGWPGIRCGWRAVSVMEGRKYVRVASRRGHHKFTKSEWTALISDKGRPPVKLSLRPKAFERKKRERRDNGEPAQAAR